MKHTDTVSMKFNHMPSGFEVGAFGLKSDGDHQTGEPVVGVHKSIASNNLSGLDFFDPEPESDAWVAGATSFDLGSLAPGSTISMDVILALQTSFVKESDPINLVIRDVFLDGDKFTIDFEETTMNERVAFILRESETGAMPREEWNQVPVPYTSGNAPNGWFRFQRTVEASKPTLLMYIQPTIINEE